MSKNATQWKPTAAKAEKVLGLHADDSDDFVFLDSTYSFSPSPALPSARSVPPKHPVSSVVQASVSKVPASGLSPALVITKAPVGGLPALSNQSVITLVTRKARISLGSSMIFCVVVTANERCSETRRWIVGVFLACYRFAGACVCATIHCSAFCRFWVWIHAPRNCALACATFFHALQCPWLLQPAGS